MEEFQSRLSILEQELKDGEITLKGFEKKRKQLEIDFLKPEVQYLTF